VADQIPALWSAEMFEVHDSAIPSNWEVRIGRTDDTGYLSFAPASWHRPGFWDDLDEWSPLTERASEDYKRELAIILSEAGWR
jgi:hypothetical protein